MYIGALLQDIEQANLSIQFTRENNGEYTDNFAKLFFDYLNKGEEAQEELNRNKNAISNILLKYIHIKYKDDPEAFNLRGDLARIYGQIDLTLELTKHPTIKERLYYLMQQNIDPIKNDGLFMLEFMYDRIAENELGEQKVKEIKEKAKDDLALKGVKSIVRLLACDPKYRNSSLREMQQIEQYKKALHYISRQNPNLDGNAKIIDIANDFIGSYKTKYGDEKLKTVQQSLKMINENKVAIKITDTPNKAFISDIATYEELKNKHSKEGTELQITKEEMEDIKQKLGKNAEGKPIVINLAKPAAAAGITFGVGLLLATVLGVTIKALYENQQSLSSPIQDIVTSVARDWQEYIAATAMILVSAVLIAGMVAFAIEYFNETKQAPSL